MAQAARQLASISDDKLQEVRDRVDLVAIVQRRVPLKKSGRDWKGLCPFHGEKSPSFYVVPDKKIFHCFGCGATGDAIKFVMQQDGKSFREAVEGLAQEAGVELAPADPEESRRASRRAALAEVNEKACRFYERVLWEHPRGAIAREHLQKRGITEETARSWRLGYAPSLWDALAKSLVRAKVDPKLIEEAGLAVPRKSGAGAGSLYDRFRGRLIVPITEAGRIIAFGGRLIEGESDAKYLNSPETPLYQKGNTLFGFDRARTAIRKDLTAFFVEGYFDAIGLHQAGVGHAVATCGTALTEKHLDLVLRAGAQEVTFIFDGDAAGVRAAHRASEIASAAGVTARVVVPPQGSDPDEFVLKHAKSGFRDLRAAGTPALDFLLEHALADLPKDASVEQRAGVVKAVEGLIRAAKDPLARSMYVERVAEKIGASPQDVLTALDRTTPASPKAVSRTVSATPPAPAELYRLTAKTELVIVAMMLRSPALCLHVDASGISSRLSVASLRDLAEQAFVHARRGDLDAASLVQVVEPDWLRQRLVDASREMDVAGDTSDAERARLTQLIAKHEKTLAQEQAARKQHQTPPVAKIRS